MVASENLKFVNGSGEEVLVIVEPWAEQFRIEPGQEVDIIVKGGVPGQCLTLEYMPKCLIIYGWDGCVISIVSDGNCLGQSAQ